MASRKTDLTSGVVLRPSDWLADEHAQRDLEREAGTPFALAAQRPRGPRYLRSFRPPPQRVYRGGVFRVLRSGGRR